MMINDRDFLCCGSTRKVWAIAYKLNLEPNHVLYLQHIGEKTSCSRVNMQCCGLDSYNNSNYGTSIIKVLASKFANQIADGLDHN